MKERLITFLKENKKKIAAFLLAGIAAAAGVAADPTALDTLAGFLSGLI